jgi:hypothetical protein
MAGLTITLPTFVVPEPKVPKLGRLVADRPDTQASRPFAKRT